MKQNRFWRLFTSVIPNQGYLERYKFCSVRPKKQELELKIESPSIGCRLHDLDIHNFLHQRAFSLNPEQIIQTGFVKQFN